MPEVAQNDKIYTEWKKLRNRLAYYDLNDSLATIRWYFNRKQTQFNFPIPSDLQPHPNLDELVYFLPWELETLVREIIIVCRDNPTPRYTMRNPDHLASAINKLKAVTNKVTEEYVNEDNVQHEISVRLSHRQFKYSTNRPNLVNLVRYFLIFSDPRVEPYLQQKTSLSIRQIYTIGTTLWSALCRDYSLRRAGVYTSLPGLTQDDLSRFLSYFAKPIEEVRAMLSSPKEHPMNDEFEYAYSSLYAYPLLEIESEGETAITCPLSTLFAWRFTSGLYYDLYDFKVNGVDFGSVFGHAYEDYIGNVLRKTFLNTNVNISAGEPNTGSNPNTCDWIIELEDEILLVETKTKRLSMAAKTSLISSAQLTQQLEILAKAVCQVYKSYIAYRNGTYRNPGHVYNSDKSYFVSVVTLEQWYLMGDQISSLRTLVETYLTADGIDPTIIDTVPYIVMCSDDLERMSFLLKSKQLNEIINSYWAGQSGDTLGHEFAVYLQNRFKQDLVNYEYINKDKETTLFTYSEDSTV